jgi:hypothetical protein
MTEEGDNSDHGNRREAGILDGDVVVIRRQDTANTGDIIVALIDDEEATLKRFRRRGSSIGPANPAYKTRVLGPDRVKGQGKLISLVRRYRAGSLSAPPPGPDPGGSSGAQTSRSLSTWTTTWFTAIGASGLAPASGVLS